jgi:epoxide hydrolase-like predicted phosphatase
MIKAVIFDAGGVIIEQGKQLNEFAKIFKPENKQEFWEKINHFVGPLCKGEISESEYWKRLAESENVDPKIIPPNLWIKGYERTTRIRPDVIKLIKNLRKKHKMILIYNTIKTHVEVNRKRGLFENFDDVLNSNEVHLSKDTPEVFKLALKRNQLDAKECVFIDDIQKFVKIAESLGIKGILFKNIGQLKNELKSFGVSF